MGGAKLTIINATTARNNFFKLMEETIITNEPVIITGKSGNVVVLSESDYRSMEGLKTPLEECVEDNDE